MKLGCSCRWRPPRSGPTRASLAHPSHSGQSIGWRVWSFSNTVTRCQFRSRGATVVEWYARLRDQTATESKNESRSQSAEYSRLCVSTLKFTHQYALTHTRRGLGRAASFEPGGGFSPASGGTLRRSDYFPLDSHGSPPRLYMLSQPSAALYTPRPIY